MVREVFQPGEYSLSPHAILLPYAEAILKAQEALEGLLESPASFEDSRLDYAERQVDTQAWTEAQSALAALRAITVVGGGK
jgi:hypothetical protein